MVSLKWDAGIEVSLRWDMGIEMSSIWDMAQRYHLYYLDKIETQRCLLNGTWHRGSIAYRHKVVS